MVLIISWQSISSYFGKFPRAVLGTSLTVIFNSILFSQCLIYQQRLTELALAEGVDEY